MKISLAFIIKKNVHYYFEFYVNTQMNKIYFELKYNLISAG